MTDLLLYPKAMVAIRCICPEFSFANIGPTAVITLDTKASK